MKGDGKAYQFRVKSSAWDAHAQWKLLEPIQPETRWKYLLTACTPSFEAKKTKLPNDPGQGMVKITFLIANKTAETFGLKIDGSNWNRKHAIYGKA